MGSVAPVAGDLRLFFFIYAAEVPFDFNLLNILVYLVFSHLKSVSP